MMFPYFQVSAFTRNSFGGNPAGICLLDHQFLPDQQMQQIAWQNNLAETAFIVERAEHYDIRWFSPAIEIDLCGHATLASAHVLYQHLGRTGSLLRFQSMSGELRVERRDPALILDFPAQPLSQCAPPSAIGKALGKSPGSVWKGRDYYAVFEKEEDVAGLKPDFQAFHNIDAQGVVATAPGTDCDFVSRYFAPLAGIPEDPATGSTHCSLIPFWSERLGKQQLSARQLSPRGGELFCENRGERVGIGGNCVTYLEGKLYLP